ncbi:4'-phosphopantetheinyl transferase [Anopheles sinensis]|uniref:4'-phosphopantetheinyl transferase n=1 Tax=Anopheles sinensis TaxID=74873 RepID=A0A084W4N9_ANOSI|nr:4'-phosphopantetheinyl transferase [Anopheles sinensis]
MIASASLAQHKSCLPAAGTPRRKYQMHHIFPRWFVRVKDFKDMPSALGCLHLEDLTQDGTV